jgi:NTE family protein
MSERPHTSFVLSGGAALGAVQVGMVRALYERGVEPDLIVGTSVGALNGAYLVSRPFVPDTADRLAEVWRRIGRGQVFPLNPLTGFLGFFGARRHLVPDGALRELLAEHLEFDRLEQASVPFHVIATDLLSGAELRLSRGNALEAVMASAAIPGVFPPVDWGHRQLIDGGVSNNAPISHALELGAERVYVLPTGSACDLEEAPRGALGMLLHSMSLLVTQRLRIEIDLLRDRGEIIVLPPPCPLGVSPIDFDHSEELIRRGLEESRSRLSALETGDREGAIPESMTAAPEPILAMRSTRRASRCELEPVAAIEHGRPSRGRCEDGGAR